MDMKFIRYERGTADNPNRRSILKRTWENGEVDYIVDDSGDVDWSVRDKGHESYEDAEKYAELLDEL